jgi:hypothetical protein
VEIVERQKRTINSFYFTGIAGAFSTGSVTVEQSDATEDAESVRSVESTASGDDASLINIATSTPKLKQKKSSSQPCMNSAGYYEAMLNIEKKKVKYAKKTYHLKQKYLKFKMELKEKKYASRHGIFSPRAESQNISEDPATMCTYFNM